MEESTKTNIKILIFMLLVGGLFIVILGFVNEKIPTIVNSTSHSPKVIEGIPSKQLSWNNITLTDHTQYDNASGICYASRLGMKVVVNPCTVRQAIPVGLTQFVSFNWTGASAHNISAIFVYTGQLEKARMYIPQNASYQYTSGEYIDTPVNNFLVSGVQGYVNLGTPTYCDVGSLHNSQSYNVTFANTTAYSRVYCFSTVTPINSTAFRISGNNSILDPTIYTGYKVDYTNDVSDRINDITNTVPTQMKKDFTFYQVTNIQFQSGQQINTKWVYTPKKASEGKWHILLYDASADSLVDAIQNNRYLYIDPFWTSVAPTVYWKFNETTGNASDSSGNGYTLMNYAGTYSGSGRAATGNMTTCTTAQCFNTTETSASKLGAGNFTIAFWYKANGSPENWILGQTTLTGGGWDMLNANGGSWYLRADGADRMADMLHNQLDDNNWKRLVIVRRAGVLMAYANGTNIKNVSYATDLSANYAFRIGVGTGSTTHNFDDYIMYNGYALTEDEITADYNGGAGREMEHDLIDGDKPIFSAEVTTANATTFTTSNPYIFNITITSTNSSAGISFNGVNFSMTNVSNNYTKSFTNLSVGTYPYYYWSYGNGSGAIYNSTTTKYYTIVKATGIVYAYVNNTRADIVVSNGTTIDLNASLVAGQGSITLYKNGTIINSGTSPLYNSTLFNVSGPFYVSANYSGNTNYTASSEQWLVNVSFGNISTTTTVTVSPASPITYGTASNFSCSNDAGLATTMTIDGVNYTSEIGALVVRSAGVHTINCSSVMSGYYMGSSSVSTYTINQGTPSLTMSISPSTTENYGTTTNATGAGCPSQLSCTLTRDGTVVSNGDIQVLAVGLYPYNYSTSGNTNYTESSAYSVLNISKGTPTMTLTLSPSNIVVNGTSTTATCSASVGTTSLARDGGSVSNPEVATLSMGSYTYNCSVTGTSNYYSASTVKTLVITPVVTGGTNGTMNFTGTNLSSLTYFAVPYNFVTSAYMNLSSTGSIPCYQETANVSTACGGSPDGYYVGGSSESYDGNWTTFANGNGLSSIYKKPANATSATLLLNYAGGTLPLNSSCFGTDDYINITFWVNGTIDRRYGHVLCDGTSIYYQSIPSVPGNVLNIYEEAMIWNIARPVTNLNITINNDQIYFYPNNFTQINNKTLNFQSQLNKYLSNCVYIGGVCYVPVIFNSSSAGLLNYSDVRFNNSGIVEYSITYDNPAYASYNYTYTLNMSYDSSVFALTPYFVYNGVTYSNLTVVGSGNNLLLSKSLNTPTLNGSYQFYWRLDMTDSYGTISYNSTINTQNTTYGSGITSGIGTCGAGLVPAFNFTFYDESNLTRENATVNYVLYYGYGNTSAYVLNSTATNINELDICINASQPTYGVGFGEVQYTTSTYEQRRYYIFSNTRATNITVAIPLYNLLTASATSFLVTAQTTALQPYEGYYVGLLRWYPELNSYKVVEMGRTDDKGQTVLRVKTEDVDYRLALYEEDGTLIKLLAPIRMICQTNPCTYSLFADSITTDLRAIGNIQNSLTWNGTSKRFTFTWNDPSQASQTMNLTVYLEGGGESSPVCSSVSSSYTGVLICDVSAYSGRLKAEVRRSASPTLIFAQLYADVKELFSDVGGGAIGLFMGAILVIFLALIGVFNPVLAVILGIIGLIPVYLLGNINWSVMVGIAVIGGVVVHFIRKVQ